MTKQLVNIGTAPNDGTGDPLRDAFGKHNNNITELYAALLEGGTRGAFFTYDVTPSLVRRTGGTEGQVPTVDSNGDLVFATPATPSSEATAGQIHTGTAGVYISPAAVEAAAVPVALTDAATIAVDWSTFINGEVTLADNRTLGAPTNPEPGTTRTILVIQDGIGSRTLAFDAVYKFVGGTAPTLSTAAGAKDFLSIYCRSATEFYVTSALGLA